MTGLLRSLKVGPRLLRLRRAYHYGISVEVNTFLAKRRYLSTATSLRPIAAGAGDLDCFMLLNEPRIWEGVWSLYSFRLNVGPCRLIVLNDGTLKRESIELLESLFPGICIPDFESNNIQAEAHLSRLGLRRCRQWREKFVLFRKLTDPVRLAQSDRIILLDSDCLHFRCPDEVQAWAKRPTTVRFIADVHAHSFCGPPAELSRICGASPPDFFCTGYLCLPAGAVDLARIERYLAEECFERQLSTGRFAHVAEQTLFAMEAALIGAEILPADYATCPDVPAQDVAMGHYCGGSYPRTWFYTKGLPLVSESASRQ